MGNTIEAIAFDVGNVLVELHYDRMVGALAAAGGGDATALRPRIDELLADRGQPASLKSQYETGRIDSEEFVRRFNTETGLKMTTAVFRDAWNELFSENKGVKSIVEKLSRQRPLTLLSNTNSLHADRFLVDYEVMRHFPHHVFSYRVGAMKPDEGIYRAALDQLGLAPHELFFIDDGEMNIDGALKLGIKTFHYAFNDDKLCAALRNEGLEV